MAVSMCLKNLPFRKPTNLKMFHRALGNRRLQFRSLELFARYQSSSPQSVRVVGKESEYVDTPEYPALFDTSYFGRKRLLRQDWYDSIKALPTAEEKLLAQCKNEPVYAMIVNGLHIGSSNLAMRQFITSTHVINELPAYYNGIQVDALAEVLRPSVLELIRTVFNETDFHGNNKATVSYSIKKEQALGRRMVDNIFRMVSQFANEFNHLRDCQVDYEPRCHAFWFKGGFNPPPNIKLYREKQKIGKMLPVDYPVDMLFQYEDTPYLQLRNQQPLHEFISREDPICKRVDVPKVEYHPNAVGFKYAKRNPTSVPGCWPSDPCGFGTLSFHTREIFKSNSVFPRKSTQDNIHDLGVTASFAWLCGLAYNKGFSPYHELTYPLATQTVVTNGKLWSFYAYQLNTLCLAEDVCNNDRQNICWATDELNLFNSVEGGEVIGFNEIVFKNLLKFFVNQPQEKVDVNLSPYLAPHEHSKEVWEYVQSSFKEKYCNRPKIDRDEIFLWEKIYKRYFNTVIGPQKIPKKKYL